MITSGQVTVGTATPVLLGGAHAGSSKIHIHNQDNTKVLYLGGSTVTAATGLRLLKEDSIELDLYAGEAVFAISGSGDHTVSWLRQTS
jgi:hypothetical protein